MVTRAVVVALGLALVSAPALAQPLDEIAQESEPETAPAGEEKPAEKAAPAAAPAPAIAKLHHAPVSLATAHEPLEVHGDIEHPELVKRAILMYQNPGESFHEVEFLRASSGPYVATIPAEAMHWPSVAYTIELELTDGRRVVAFASRERPYVLEVPEDLMDIRERALYERLGSRRSVFSAFGEYVSFGQSIAQDPTTGETIKINDQYFRIEGGYTYRPLRLVTEFGIRAGVVRGNSPVPVRELVPGQSESDRYKVGLNYIAPSVRFHLHDLVHLDVEALGSITEVGFSAGGGGALLLGDAYGSKLTLGFESIGTFGNRFYSRLDVVATQQFIIAPIIEATNMPSAKDYGVRLLGEFLVDMGGGFSAAARVGYQARVSTSGGPSFGGRLSYAF